MPLFDVSNFKTHNYLHSDKNRKALFFKDEISTDLIKEFIGIRSKLYVIKTVSNQEDKNVKAIIKSLDITF